MGLKQRNTQGIQVSMSKQPIDEKEICGKNTIKKKKLLPASSKTIFLINASTEENIYAVLKCLTYQIDVSIIVLNNSCILRRNSVMLNC